MDYFRSMMDLGDNIMDQVSKAVDSNDFSGLADGIKNELNGYQNEVKRMKAGEKAAEEINKHRPSGSFDPYASSTRETWKDEYRRQRAEADRENRQRVWDAAERRAESRAARETDGANRRAQRMDRKAAAEAVGRAAGQAAAEARARGTSAVRAAGQAFTSAWNQNVSPFLQKRPPKTGSTVKAVFGVIGCLLFIPAAITALNPLDVVSGGVCGFFAAASAALAYNGVTGRNLIGRFYRYGSLIGQKEYVDIPRLASAAGEKISVTKKQLDRMIRKNYLPGARYDESGNTLLLTSGAYEQYQDVMRERAEQEEREAAKQAEADGLDPESREILEEGEKFIAEIHQANVDIPGEEMSAKLDQLEAIVRRIFARVKREPKSAPALRKFMSYYVPTIRKLLNAYVILDRQPEAGDNIVNTKKEIEDAIDQVNRACEVLLNSLFEDTAWDISSDISVMKTMMAQDGLAPDEPDAK